MHEDRVLVGGVLVGRGGSVPKLKFASRALRARRHCLGGSQFLLLARFAGAGFVYSDVFCFSRASRAPGKGGKVAAARRQDPRGPRGGGGRHAERMEGGAAAGGSGGGRSQTRWMGGPRRGGRA
jgi:hypothetical protein